MNTFETLPQLTLESSNLIHIRGSACPFKYHCKTDNGRLLFFVQYTTFTRMVTESCHIPWKHNIKTYYNILYKSEFLLNSLFFKIDKQIWYFRKSSKS